MRISGLAGFMTILAATGAGTSTAAAQVIPLELILPPRHDAAPVTARSAAQGFNLSPAPPPPAFVRQPDGPSRRPAAAPSPGPVAALQDAVPQASAPLPPRPPRSAPSQAQPGGPASGTPEAVVAAIPRPVSTVRPEPLSTKDIVDRANAYFTNLGTMVADFTQIGGDGRKLGGTLYLQRPGKVRFEYDPPATLEVIADGSSVAVRDKKLATQDLYSIAQTPLKFLLRERVDLGQDIAIGGITQDGDSVRLALEDRSTLGGTSRITLYFDPKVETMTQWRIVDPQGFQTAVVLNKVVKGGRIDPGQFKIQYEAILDNSNR